MSDSLPKPLASINALRAHLKLLERGVNAARDRRTGPPPVAAQPAIQPVRREAPRPIHQAQAMQAARAIDSGKPKAKPKSSADFSEFFQDIQRRAAG